MVSRQRRGVVGVVWVAVLCAVVAAVGLPQAPAEAADQNVIIVVIDGIRYSETFGDPLHRYIPHIWYGLRPKGTIHTNFYNRGETVTLGAHASMLTGSRSWITWPPEGELSRPAIPTLFEQYRAATGAEQSKAWMVANHVQSLEGMTYGTHPDYGSAPIDIVLSIDGGATWGAKPFIGYRPSETRGE